MLQLLNYADYFHLMGYPTKLSVIMDQVVSDNGPQFVSEEFKSFLKSNGVKHICCSPYHSSSNGAVERFVQTFKKAMLAQNTKLSFQQRLMSFLLTYRITPHTTTNVAPCTLFLN